MRHPRPPGHRCHPRHLIFVSSDSSEEEDLTNVLPLIKAPAKVKVDEESSCSLVDSMEKKFAGISLSSESVVDECAKKLAEDILASQAGLHEVPIVASNIDLQNVPFMGSPKCATNLAETPSVIKEESAKKSPQDITMYVHPYET